MCDSTKTGTPFCRWTPSRSLSCCRPGITVGQGSSRGPCASCVSSSYVTLPRFFPSPECWIAAGSAGTENDDCVVDGCWPCAAAHTRVHFSGTCSRRLPGSPPPLPSALSDTGRFQKQPCATPNRNKRLLFLLRLAVLVVPVCRRRRRLCRLRRLRRRRRRRRQAQSNEQNCRVWRAINATTLFVHLLPAFEVVIQLRRQMGFHDGADVWRDYSFETLGACEVRTPAAHPCICTRDSFTGIARRCCRQYQAASSSVSMMLLVG